MMAAICGGRMLQRLRNGSYSLDLVVHQLPLWFLVFSLFLPRIALLVAWLRV